MVLILFTTLTRITVGISIVRKYETGLIAALCKNNILSLKKKKKIEEIRFKFLEQRCVNIMSYSLLIRFQINTKRPNESQKKN